LKNDDLKKWQARINYANTKFKEGLEKNIKLWRNYYKGSQWADNTTSYKDKTVDNQIFTNIKSMLAHLNMRNPHIYVKPAKKSYQTERGLFDTGKASIAAELLINYYWRYLKIKEQMRKVLLDALIGPWGIMQVGYTSSTEKVKGDELLEVNELIKENSPYCLRLSPLDLRIDPLSKQSDLSDANWIAIKWIKSLQDVKKNPNYKSSNLRPNVTSDGYSENTGRDTREYLKDDIEQVEGWDIWDKKTKQVITLTDNHDKALRERLWPHQFEGFPIEILYFNENPDELEPVSEIDINMPKQDELNRMRSMQLSHIRRLSLRKYLANDNALDSEEEAKLANGPDGTVVKVAGSPETAVAVLKDAAISQDIYMIVANLTNELRSQMGVTQLDLGIAGKFDTAEESKQLTASSSPLKAEKADLLEAFMAKIASKLFNIIQENMLESQSLPLHDLAGEDTFVEKIKKILGGQEMFLNVNQEDINGEYNFQIAAGSTQPINYEQRKRNAIELYSILKDNPLVNPIVGTKRILEIFDELEPEKYLRDPKEVQQESEMARIKGVEAEIAVDKPKRDTDLQKTKIKSQTSLMQALIKSRSEAKKAKKEKSDASV